MKIESIALALLAAAIAFPAAADEINLPARKSGEWQIVMQIGGHTITTQQCVDSSTDKAMMQSSFAKAGEDCSSVKQSQDGGTITIDAKCTFGGMQTQTHAIVTGDFQSAYTVDAVNDVTGGPPQMPKHSEMKQNVSWVGACPAGMQPGDIEMPGGMKINLKALQATQPPG